MRRCAFLTLQDPTGFVIDDELAYGPLLDLGWQVEAVPWNRPGVDWTVYDAVAIRSPWDYQSDPEAFLEVLETIERSGVPLFNDLHTVRGNLNKNYLRDLERQGVPMAPTLWRDRLGTGDLHDLYEELGEEEIVLKPIVGANADGAFWLDCSTVRSRAREVEAYYAEQALLAQPFLWAVLEEGEYSLFYFDGVFSHGVRKTPKAEDFRVQEEHGGFIQPVEPEDSLLRAGDRAFETLEQAPLYARADFVRANDGGGFWLMELELIEPSLYFRMDPEAPMRFARALDRRVKDLHGTMRAP